MDLNEILNILNKYSKLDERYQIKYISPCNYSKLANELNDNIQDLRVSLNGKDVKFKLKDNVITIENEMNISDSDQLNNLKNKLSFRQWKEVNNYRLTGNDFIRKGKLTFTAVEVFEQYKKYVNEIV